MLREIVIGVSALLVGGLLGNALSGKVLDGRLSACKDMTGVMNLSLPLQLECGVVKGEVFITSPVFGGKRFSLDGKREL